MDLRLRLRRASEASAEWRRAVRDATGFTRQENAAADMAPFVAFAAVLGRDVTMPNHMSRTLSDLPFFSVTAHADRDNSRMEIGLALPLDHHEYPACGMQGEKIILTFNIVADGQTPGAVSIKAVHPDPARDVPPRVGGQLNFGMQGASLQEAAEALVEWTAYVVPERLQDSLVGAVEVLERAVADRLAAIASSDAAPGGQPAGVKGKQRNMCP